MKPDWNQLLSDYRCPSPGKEARPSRPDTFRSPFEADYDRIVYSPPFRRLARKTQVHSMNANDHVHNRLTHSIEVASVGRSLARRLTHFLKNRDEFPLQHTAEDICQTVQAACLAHDIGNPPFGHGGEYAIRQWVSDHQKKIFGEVVEAVDEGVRRDWEIFEGNAQGFRMAARADNAQAGYMRLTYATLGAMIKYPWDSQDERALARGKYNVFSTERELFSDMFETMGLKRADGSFARHPLSFLSEAADDICYRILDLEDAVEMKILDEKFVRPVISKFFSGHGSSNVASSNLKSTDHKSSGQRADDDNTPLPILRSKAIKSLVDATWQVFEDNYCEIMNGDREFDLKSQLDQQMVEALHEVDEHYQTIFADRSKIATELGSYKLLGRIIEAVCSATLRLADEQSYTNAGFLSQRTLELAWGKDFAVENQHQPYEWWLHQTMDFVASLTDNTARQLSREIVGV